MYIYVEIENSAVIWSSTTCNLYERTFYTSCLSGQAILKINEQNQAIYTIQQPIKIHLRSP